MVEKVDGIGGFASGAKRSLEANYRQSAAAKADAAVSKAPGIESSGVAVEIDGAVKDVKAKDERRISREDAEELSDKLNALMEEMNFNVTFSYYEKLDQLMMQIIDRRTNEVIKEFPPKEIMESQEKMHDWIGAILDQKA